MATPQEHETLYRTLRNSLLSRHLAGGRYFRSNLFSESNIIDLNAPEDVARYRLIRRDLENPLFWGAGLAAALSVECALGNAEARSALTAMLESTRSLFRFHQGDEFDGYPIRWTPVDSDQWQTDSEGNLLYNRDMLLDGKGGYLYALPVTDPRAIPWRAWNTLQKLLGEEQFTEYRDIFWNFFRLHRGWELSGDELIGLLGIYTTIYDLSGDAGLQAEVRAQLLPLAHYLASNAFLLVRPCGGFNARGAAGLMPAIEAPLRLLLRRATGSDEKSASFTDAMKKAGVWSVLEAPVNEMVIGGTLLAPVVLGTSMGLFSGMITALLGPLANVVLGVIGASTVAVEAAFAEFTPDLISVLEAVSVWMHRDVFDVFHTFGEHDTWHSGDNAGEFAIACLLHGIAAPDRYKAFLMATPFLDWDKPPNSFPPYLALCAFDDPAAVQAYLKWFNDWQGKRPDDSDTPPLGEKKLKRPWLCLPAAVAALLGGGPAAETELLRRLNARYELIQGSHSGDLEIFENDDGSICEKTLYDVDYVGAVALAWMHKQRCIAKGESTIPDFPVLPADIQGWVKAVLPATAVDPVFPARFGFIHPPAAPPADIQVFGDETPTGKPEVPPPVMESGEKPLLCDVIVAMPRKHANDVFSGISLRNGDDWQVDAISATGSGFGALGRKKIVTNTGYPLHTGLDPNRAIDQALLARLGGWIYIGVSRARETFWYPHGTPMKLYFRLNMPESYGRGRFLIRVRVWGTRPPLAEPPGREVAGVTRMGVLLRRGRFARHVMRICGGTEDAPWHLSIDEVVRWIEEEKHEFVVPGNPPSRIIVARLDGHVYLRAVGDKSSGNELRDVPACQHPFP